MSKAKTNWAEFVKYSREGWESFVTKAAKVPWYLWVLQIVYLVTLFGGMVLSIHYMITWMDNLAGPGEYVYELWHELVFWGWLIGTIVGMFLYRYVYVTITDYFLRKFDLLTFEE